MVMAFLMKNVVININHPLKLIVILEWLLEAVLNFLINPVMLSNVIFIKRDFYLNLYSTSTLFNLDGFIFLGNDLNDLEAINLAGFSIAPLDCHPIIKKNADLIINKKGGNGFVREFIEILIKIKEFDKKDLSELI